MVSGGGLSDTGAVGARADYALAYATRVGSPLDFQLKRVSAPSCLRALRFKRFGRSSRCVHVRRLALSDFRAVRLLRACLC